MMKKVLHYKNDTYLNHTENWIYEQIKNVHTFIPIVYSEDVKNRKSYPIKYIRSFPLTKNSINPRQILDKISIKLIGSPISFFFYLLIDKPDLIHSHYGNSGFNFLLSKRLLNIPMITTFYGFDLGMLPVIHLTWAERYKKLFKYSDAFLVEGSSMKRKLVRLGCPQDKITIFHLGIDLSIIEFKKRTLRAGEAIKILISARFVEKKGIPNALKAIALLLKKHPDIKIRITIIGDSNSSEESINEKKAIQSTIKKYNLNEYIKQLGNQPHSVFIKELYNHHIFLHPSITAKNGDSEGGAPVSIIEASASGMPIVSTTHCDIPEIVLNKKSGYLAPENNIELLYKGILSIISKHSTWREMGLAGKNHIEKNYNSVIQGKILEKIYKNTMNKKNHSTISSSQE
jgi:colanic acid/amylovoran biosynthesis glycosyltransferase